MKLEHHNTTKKIRTLLKSTIKYCQHEHENS